MNIGLPYPNRLGLVPESATSFVAYDLVQERVIARALLRSKPGFELELGKKKVRLTPVHD